jgi:hypothetical protein
MLNRKRRQPTCCYFNSMQVMPPQPLVLQLQDVLLLRV